MNRLIQFTINASMAGKLMEMQTKRCNFTVDSVEPDCYLINFNRDLFLESVTKLAQRRAGQAKLRPPTRRGGRM